MADNELNKKVVFKIIPVPGDANIKLTANGYYQTGNSIVVPSGTPVHYIISKTGYSSKEGDYTPISTSSSNNSLSSSYWKDYTDILKTIDNDDYSFTNVYLSNAFLGSNQFLNSDYWKLNYIQCKESNVMFPVDSITPAYSLYLTPKTTNFNPEIVTTHYISQKLPITVTQKHCFSFYVYNNDNNPKYVALSYHLNDMNHSFTKIFNLDNNLENHVEEENSDFLDNNTFNFINADSDMFTSLNSIFSNRNVKCEQLGNNRWRISISAIINAKLKSEARMYILNDEKEFNYSLDESSLAQMYINDASMDIVGPSYPNTSLPKTYIQSGSTPSSRFVKNNLFLKSGNKNIYQDVKMWYFDDNPIGSAKYSTDASENDIGVINSFITLNPGSILGKSMSSELSDNEYIYYDFQNKSYVFYDNNFNKQYLTSDKQSSTKIRKSIIDSLLYTNAYCRFDINPYLPNEKNTSPIFKTMMGNEFL